jgi:hypothetical protein
MTVGRVIAAVAILLIPGAGLASAQASSAGTSHRPWFGVGLGPGTFTGPELQGPDMLLSATLEVPVTTTGSVRVSAERIWTSARGYGDASLRQLSADLLIRRTVSSSGMCDMQAVVGLGAGLFSFAFESGSPQNPTQGGYQISAGADCVGRRLGIGGLFGFRFVEAPQHPAFTSDVVVAASLSLTVRVRF